MHIHPTPALPFNGKMIDVQQIAVFIYNTASVFIKVMGINLGMAPTVWISDMKLLELA